MLKRIANLHVLHVRGQLGQSSGWRQPQLHYGIRYRVTVLRREVKPVQFTKDFNPSNRPRDITLAIDVAERAKCEVGFWAGEVVEFSAGCLSKHPDRITPVECEHLRPRIVTIGSPIEAASRTPAPESGDELLDIL